MREILFKAKRIDNDEWVEGYYTCDQDLNIHYITGWTYDVSDSDIEREFFMEQVNPQTICQFTGLYDKNGNKIWENDIVEIPREDDYFRIEWQEDTASFVMTNDSFIVTFDNYWPYEVEVVDSVFDNPELLKGGAK